MRRHDRLTALGILVLHFTPRQIRYEPEHVLAMIRTALASRQGQQSQLGFGRCRRHRRAAAETPTVRRARDSTGIRERQPLASQVGSVPVRAARVARDSG